MIKGFFFDLDGTLVDTHHANFEAYKRALQDFGVDISFDDFKKTIGMQAKSSGASVTTHFSIKKYPKTTPQQADRLLFYIDDVLIILNAFNIIIHLNYLSILLAHYLSVIDTNSKPDEELSSKIEHSI